MTLNASYKQYDRFIYGDVPTAQPDTQGIDNELRTRALYICLLARQDIRNTQALLHAALAQLPESDPVIASLKSGVAPSVIDDTRGYVLCKCLQAMREPHWLEREKLLNYAIAQLPKTDEAFTLSI